MKPSHSISVAVWAVLMLAPVFAEQPGSPSIASPPYAPAFYAFENGVRFGSAEQDAKVLRELGFAGISQVHAGGDKLGRQVAAFEKAGSKVLSVYLDVGETPLTRELVQPLANRDALIEITIRKLTPKTVQAVRETAEMASQLNIRVALYPHHGNAIATMPQAMELIQKVGHPNLGVIFNLCHFLKNEKVEDLEVVLKTAGSRLFAVSTCGANSAGEDWGQLIKPLNQGDFPQTRLMRTLKKLDFQGPVGLQCYGVPGDKRKNLIDSMAAWKKILTEL
ncbi:MAG: TIM barrel protein [Rubripirellula sp.]|nr:TIM barrel protein [Rubripirellula sp.]